MREKLCVGLDFGTSNSAIAVSNRSGVKLVEAEPGKTTQPSSIFITVDGYISTGSKAIEDFQNVDTRSDEYHFIPSVKPGLSLKYYDGNVIKSRRIVRNGRPLTRFFPVEELGGALISQLKNRAEEQLNTSIESVVLGRPVRFSTDEKLDKLAQTRLERSAKEAGFKNIRFVLEPVAAAIYYDSVTLRKKAQKILVFDFGGGTLDISILDLPQKDEFSRLDYECLSRRILAVNGVDLGGTDLDKDIFISLFSDYFGFNATYDTQKLSIPRYIPLDVTEWHLKDVLHRDDIFDFLGRVANDLYCTDPDSVRRLLILIKDQQVYPLLRNIETAKIQLSENRVGHITHDFKNIMIDAELTQDNYIRIVRPRIRTIKNCIEECLELAQLTPGDVNVVLKVGGSSNNIFVNDLLSSMFKNRIDSLELFTSVVSGLAVVGNELQS